MWSASHLRPVLLLFNGPLLMLWFVLGVTTASAQAPTPKPYPDPWSPPMISGAPLNLHPPSIREGPLAMEDWSRLVYQSYRDGNWEIYIGNGAGESVANLTRHPATDARPQLNRGATLVVFDSDRDGNQNLFRMSATGGDTQRLTDDPGADYSASWSPDSTRIAFVSNRSGNNDIFSMNADGSGVTQLTYAAASDSSPTWAPDGSTIAWRRVNPGASVGEIWLMNADGSNQRLLRGDLKYMGQLIWMPQGGQLVTDADVDLDFWNEIIRVNVSGGYSVVYDAGERFVDVWTGSVSPDGQWVVFS